jgi:hypothetical protein
MNSNNRLHRTVHLRRAAAEPGRWDDPRSPGASIGLALPHH